MNRKHQRRIGKPFRLEDAPPRALCACEQPRLSYPSRNAPKPILQHTHAGLLTQPPRLTPRRTPNRSSLMICSHMPRLRATSPLQRTSLTTIIPRPGHATPCTYYSKPSRGSAAYTQAMACEAATAARRIPALKAALRPALRLRRVRSKPVVLVTVEPYRFPDAANREHAE